MCGGTFDQHHCCMGIDRHGKLEFSDEYRIVNNPDMVHCYPINTQTLSSALLVRHPSQSTHLHIAMINLAA